MATTPLTPIVSGFNLTTAFQKVFTVTTSGIGIDAVVVNNYSIDNVKLTVRITQSGVSTVFNEIITEESIRSKENNLVVGLIGQGLTKGGFIEMKVDFNDRANLSITATVVTI